MTALLLGCSSKGTSTLGTGGGAGQGGQGGAGQGGQGGAGQGGQGGAGGGTAGTTGMACTPGEFLPCLCSGGEDGTQTCEPDGFSFGPCECAGACTLTSRSVEYLLTVSTAVMPDQPVLFLANASIHTDGTAVDFEVQALSAADRTTLVGSPTSLNGPAPIKSDGSFTTPSTTLDIVAEANPITMSPMTVDVSLDGGFLCDGVEFVCGDVIGSVTVPLVLDLSGSTFTMQEIVGPPPSPLKNCARDPVTPL